MKKLSFLLGFLAITLGAFSADVNEAVLKIFNRTYPGAESVSWSAQNNGYLVYFTKKDVSYRVMYDPEGSVTLSFKYYGEDQLSPLVLNRVKKSYPDYKIHSVIEKSSESNVEYHIILEGTKKLITVRSDTIGNLDVLSKYDRGE